MENPECQDCQENPEVPACQAPLEIKVPVEEKDQRDQSVHPDLQDHLGCQVSVNPVDRDYLAAQG